MQKQQLNLTEKIYRLKVSWDADYFADMLTKYRKMRNLSLDQLAVLLGKNKQQVFRYERKNGDYDKQLPPLEVFSELCYIMQIDPKVFLHMEWVNVDDFPEDGIIYRYNICNHDKKLYWLCPKCNRLNLEVDVIFKGKSIFELYCSECNEMYSNLYNKNIKGVGR
jgi:transcriptional regulator with XRE-family HTH domain